MWPLNVSGVHVVKYTALTALQTASKNTTLAVYK